VRQIKVCGDDLLSVAIDSRGKRAAIAQQLRDSGAWLECVEGMACIVLQFDSTTISIADAEQRLLTQLQASAKRKPENTGRIEIPVCYGGEFGPEFDSICEMMGVTADELIRIHTDRDYRIVLIGFTPGFAYLAGAHDELQIPRLTDPRQHVAAGSIGIAAGLTGVYATAGPGGWPLLGRTPITLLNADAQQPFVLRVGMRVRFSAIDADMFARLAAP
jgi:KipI family sensor histidine kinase inhibitor